MAHKEGKDMTIIAEEAKVAYHELRAAWKVVAANKINTIDDHVNFIVNKIAVLVKYGKLDINDASSTFITYLGVAFTPSKIHNYDNVVKSLKKVKVFYTQLSKGKQDNFFDFDFVTDITIAVSILDEAIVALGGLELDSPPKYYRYLIIRADLSVPQQIIQATHVASLIRPSANEDSVNLCLLAVENHASMLSTLEKINSFVRMTHYIDPMHGNSISAAISPLIGAKSSLRSVFKGIPFYTFN